MKKLSLILVMTMVLISNLNYARAEEEKVKIKLEERTIVPVVLIQNLQGKDVIMGQSVDLTVNRDIIIDNYILIKRGAPAYATITSVEKAGYVSQGGKVGLSMDYCKAVDGTKIYLKSMLSEEGKSNVGANIAASIIVCPLILLIKGKEAEIPQGTEFKAYVENDAFVSVLKSSRLSDQDITDIEQKEKEEKEREEAEKQKKEEKPKQVIKGRNE